MISHRRQGQTVGNIARIVAHEVKEVFPKLPALIISYTESQQQPRQRPDVLDDGAGSRLDAVFMKPRETLKGDVVILAWAIDVSEDPLVAFDQDIAVHFRDEIECAVGVVAVAHKEQAIFFFKAPPELSIR